MGRYNAAALMAGMGAAITVSQEDNDLNININADHEGDSEGGDAGDVQKPASRQGPPS